MKLKSLHIKDYKVFKDFDIDFLDSDDNPLPIVVLAGVNGSGKTTLFEFIVEFFEYEKNELVAKMKGETFGLGGTYSFGAFIDVNKDIEHYNSIKSFRLSNTRIHNTIYIPAGINDIADIESEFVKYWYNLVKFHNKRNDEITAELQKFIIDTFDGLELSITYSHIDKNDNIYFQNENNEKFKINQLSTGEKTLLSKVLYLFFQDYKDKVILIDEPELSLHPSWQNKVLKIYENFAKANNCQVIIATHSPHIIVSAKNEYLRILRKNSEGNIEVVNDVLAYGRDIEWVLEEVMGIDYVRNKKILDKMEVCQNLINDEKYEEAQEAIDKLEELIGENDKDILALRNDLAFERIDFEEDS